jgi:hypothetical protein
LLAATCLLQTTTGNTAVLFEAAGGAAEFPTSQWGWSIQEFRPNWDSATQFAAMPFKLEQQSEVTGAQLALAGEGTNWSIQIRADDHGFPDSEPLWYVSPRDPIPYYLWQQPTHAFTTVSGEPVLFQADTTYWLYLGCAAKCQFTWWAGDSNPAPVAIEYNNVYPYNLRWALSNMSSGMFRIIGNPLYAAESPAVEPIPEPAPVFLIAAGMAALGVRCFKCKRVKTAISRSPG